MEKQTITKIISGLIILVFIISFFQFSNPLSAATDSSISSLYSNPNQNGNKNPYKFKVSDVVNSNLLTNVVGCTGVVNKVSTWMMKFVQSPAQQAAISADKLLKIKDQLKSTCSTIKAASEAGAGVTPQVNDLVSPIKTVFSKLNFKVNGQNVKACQEQVDATDDAVLAQAVKEAELENETKLKEQCFDGIAVTLAKNQLTAMTRSAMNWVNSGYGGNPFFVQNMNNLTNNIERNVLETGIDILMAPSNQNPYASDFARTAIRSRGILSSSSNFLGGLQSSLEYFVSDPNTYYSRTALERAQYANDSFANDFSTGGWNGWLALTQIDENNPMGYTMKAAQFLEDQEMTEVQNVKDELVQNNGFMSQKECLSWKRLDENGATMFDEENHKLLTTTNPTQAEKENPNGCSDWKIITPGSIIKDKTTNYLNSPERQLELADTINDSLNALFSILISKLEDNGLSGLSDAVVNTDWTDNMNEITSTDGNSAYDNNGAYDGFNLTRDLGNTYIYDGVQSLGTWNAKTNTISTTSVLTNGKKLYPDLAPENYDSQGVAISTTNTYYTVNTEGKTKLILEGYNGWKVGDRAFWNGKEWQNWQNGQPNPIKKRGVIQIQKDYIVAAKEILQVLPNVMPKLGELDYCLPGPNPSYKTNSTDAQSAYNDWLGSMYVGIVDSSGERFGVKIDGTGSRTYKDFQAIYTDNPGVWTPIKVSLQWLINQFSNICDGGNDSCDGSYIFANGGSVDSTIQGHLDSKQDIMDANLNYSGSHLFQNFYEVFDKMMDNIYFKSMKSKYLEREDLSSLDPNPAYIQMAESGLDLTKNITYYNDDITKATISYNDAINQAKVNIAKLEPIKEEVSQIIRAAQARRDARLLEQLARQSATSDNPMLNPMLTPAQYKTKYASCLDEENIQFYDEDTIMNTGGADFERCTNGIDDDLDGLVDTKDPDCLGAQTGNGNGTPTIIYNYYTAQSCQQTQTFETGPYPNGTYSSGDRVQGGSGLYYVITNSQTDPYIGYSNISTTGTGARGCPN